LVGVRGELGNTELAEKGVRAAGLYFSACLRAT
jgi:hypothetical protein